MPVRDNIVPLERDPEPLLGKLSREEAYMIASVAVDYRVTQVVDGTKGIHGMIPKAIFTVQ
jgi:acetamidase/formamidase